MRGLSTVLITLAPEPSLLMGPVRLLHPVGFPIGHATGWPGQVELQRQVTRDALELLTTPMEPGHLIERAYEER